MPTGDREEEPTGEEKADDAEGLDVVGAALGLSLMAVTGFVVGGVTVAALWMLYPPTRGSTVPMTAVALGSVALVAAGWGVLVRRLGRQAGDWFIVGYGIAWVLLIVVVMGSSAAEFFRSHAAQSLGLPSS